ncbi:hypothetical protein [Blastopirellula marina]|uniref:Uncharacterized protein n=1 Tax=Blastopirellula marina TaxID=124 RepID=A0A2S8GJ06_9BACT|nr:hypothetical protein [Blastopirellula marina]PQO44442.1 hypothetical protein C5Y93_18685 [Blastopirellula marina]
MPDYVPKAVAWLGISVGFLMSVVFGYLFGGDMNQPLGAIYMFAAGMGPFIVGISTFIAWHLNKAGN